uniref:Uncharacterized protein n=1 Tax=Arundo donax TaxID=35708 RepID=A0A0A9EFN0_ARUDO
MCNCSPWSGKQGSAACLKIPHKHFRTSCT